MAFEIPPWLKPPESIAKSYATGLEIGANISNQRAALEEKQASDALWASIAQQRALEQSQYQQAQLQQEQQRMAQDAQLNQLRIQDAQRRFAAQQQYQADISAGMQPIDAIMKNFPGTAESMTGYGQLARQLQMQRRVMQAPRATEYTDPVSGRRIGGLMYQTEAGERFTPFRDDVQERQMEQMNLRELYRQYDEARQAATKAGTADIEERVLLIPEKDRTESEKRWAAQAEAHQSAIRDADWRLRKAYHDAYPQQYPDPGPQPGGTTTTPGQAQPTAPGLSAPPGRSRTGAMQWERAAVPGAAGGVLNPNILPPGYLPPGYEEQIQNFYSTNR